MITEPEFINRINNLHNTIRSKTKTATGTDIKSGGNVLHFRRVNPAAPASVRNKISAGVSQL